MGMRRWNPWRALRAREHIELVWADMGGCPGRAERHPDRDRVLLDPTLGRIDRNAVLAHELVHLERGILYTSTTPDALIQKEEHAVETIVAGRLLPPQELAVYVDVLAEFEPVTAEAVAFEFDVPVALAQRALEQLAQRRRSA